MTRRENDFGVFCGHGRRFVCTRKAPMPCTSCEGYLPRAYRAAWGAMPSVPGGRCGPAAPHRSSAA